MNLQEMTLPRLLSWAKKGGFAVLDQGLFSGVNFVVNILLARWLSPVEYGAFAVAFSVFLLLAAFHTAILTEPMLIFGAGKYAGQFHKYLGFLLYGHAGLTAVVSLILAIVALIFWWLGSAALAPALFGLAIATPFTLLLWLLRRAFYVHLQPQWAATGGALYLLLMVAGVCGLYREGWLSSVSAFVVMGVMGLAVSLWYMRLLQPRWRFAEGNPTPAMVLGDHWRYGRWSASAVVIIWIPGNIYHAMLPVWVGLPGAAALQVVTTFVMPILNIFLAVSNLLFPVLAQQARLSDASGFHLTVRRVLKLFAIASAVYLLFLFLSGEWLLNWLYGEKYQNYTNLLLIMGLSSFSYAIIFVLGTALRVRQRLHQVVWCYVISSAVTLTLGFCLMAFWGIFGAAIGFVVSAATTAIAMALFYTFHACRPGVERA